MKPKELTVVRQLRSNARETLTKMSRKTGIPVSTIYEWLKGFEDNVITKHTCLLDFRQLGYDLRVTMLVKTPGDIKQDIQRFLQTHHRVNTVYRINNGYDFLAEVLFRTMAELQEFLDTLDLKGITERKEYYILDEISREAFLSTDAHVDLLKQGV
jgi:DNA-binding Lrp family transcriptional regulator